MMSNRRSTMPVNLSARAFLWIGISVLVASALAQTATDFVFRYAGSDLLQPIVDSWWFSLLNVVTAVFTPLGPLMVAAFFVARLIERGPGIPASAAPRITAAWVFAAGIVFTLFGALVIGSLDGWLTALNADGRTSLALDALYLVVIPARFSLIQLGLALLSASALMKKLEARKPVADHVQAATE
jgi:hypothetical protein